MEIGAHSWRNGTSLLGIERIASAGGEHHLLANLESLPLHIAQALLPANYSLAGTADAAVDLALQDGFLSGSLDWAQTGTVLEVREDNGERTAISIPGLTVDAEFNDGGVALSAALAIDPGVTGALDLSLEKLDRESGITADVQLQGREWGWGGPRRSPSKSAARLGSTN